MAVPASIEAEVHDLVRRHLSDRDIRYTPGRKAVVTAIQLASGPRSAAELVEMDGIRVPVSSLYRTLVVLEESGILRKDHDTSGIARYELSQWLSGHHHHVVCVVCGAIQDIEIPQDAERELLLMASKLGERAGYRVVDHVLEVEGVCPACIAGR
ncbi:MAG: ferric iron uptake transcriptional regulator [Acidimicrobiia bacterium]|nr:MAG: ferric iron uptake transcriptional regulator [Acidimicrobiia bacterium]